MSASAPQQSKYVSQSMKMHTALSLYSINPTRAAGGLRCAEGGGGEWGCDAFEFKLVLVERFSMIVSAECSRAATVETI